MKLKMRLIIATMASIFLVGSIGGSVAEASSSTYFDYSRMNKNSAGNFYDSQGNFSGQWSWRSEGTNRWSISWDKNRPGYREYFQLSTDGNWIMLDGWSDNGTYYKQRVTSESYANRDCKTNKHTFKSDGGRQHYTRKAVGGSYCLDARGTITEMSSGKNFTFHHRQVYEGPVKCWSKYLGNNTCLRQWEQWSDNNGHPFRVTLKRDQFLAKGKGMAFRIKQYYKWDPKKGVHSYWAASGRNYWNWK